MAHSISKLGATGDVYSTVYYKERLKLFGKSRAFSREKLCRKKVLQRNIFELFISYNFSIVPGGHFGFLQTKHE